MEGLSKILDVLKIPLKVLLPAACLFAGLLSFLHDSVLEKLGLLSWKEENHFIIGLVFLISLCLILVYIAFFLKKKVGSWIFDITMYPRTLKNISQMNDMELGIIIELYNSPGYSGTLDWGHPVVKGLLARNYIYSGNNAYVSFDVMTETWPMKVTLQPFVYRTLNHYQPKVKEKIQKLSTKIEKTKKTNKQQRLRNELSDLQQSYRLFYGKN